MRSRKWQMLMHTQSLSFSGSGDHIAFLGGRPARLIEPLRQKRRLSNTANTNGRVLATNIVLWSVSCRRHPGMPQLLYSYKRRQMARLSGQCLCAQKFLLSSKVMLRRPIL
jgi:hypothetical protein